MCRGADAYIVSDLLGNEFMIDVVCVICKSEFRVKSDAPNPVPCKICQTPIDIPEFTQRDEEIARKNAEIPTCPGCHRPLTRDVKYCTSCGTYTGDCWAAKAASFEAKEKLKDKAWWKRIKSWFVRW